MNARKPTITALLNTWVVCTATASLAATALSPRHSKEFGLRYECDVAPEVAGWSTSSGSTGTAPLATNGWIHFATSLPETLGYQNSLWSLSPSQAYTMEVRFRTPRSGQIYFSVDDGATARDALFISSTGLLWSVNGVPQWISSNQANAHHTVRWTAWTNTDQRFVQVWQDGRSVYGPTLAANPTASTGAITAFGELSNTGECDIEIDHVRMAIGAAFAPTVPELGIGRGSEFVILSWSTVPKVVYQVQWVANLVAGNWFDLGPVIPALADFGVLTESTVEQAARYYRVKETIAGSIDQAWSPDPPPVCTNIPSLFCETNTHNCAEIVLFEPVVGPGYDNYPINGETALDQYRSYIRREVRQAIQHAAARVECMAGHWPFGNNRPLGLADMSEANGAIPGTREGMPGHPGTHQDGTDVDVAYYQLDTSDNRLRSICESRQGGFDRSHCVAPPHTLDMWRTALFVGILTEHPKLRVIGVDGQVGPLLVEGVRRLADAGWLPASANTQIQLKLAYETSDQGQGWYFFHHHHMHISFRP